MRPKNFNKILSFLDLNGKGELEKAQLDSIAELHREFFDATTPFIQAKMGIPPGADAVSFFILFPFSVIPSDS